MAEPSRERKERLAGRCRGRESGQRAIHMMRPAYGRDAAPAKPISPVSPGNGGAAPGDRDPRREHRCGILASVAVQVAVCRSLCVTRDGAVLTGPGLGTRKARLLVAALAASRGAAVFTDRLTEILWPDHPPRDPQANLATLASRLRRVVGDDLVVPGPASYALGPRVELDLDRARDLLGAAASRLRRGEPTLAVASATRALEVLGDGRLAEELGDWADALRRDASERCRDARHLLAT